MSKTEKDIPYWVLLNDRSLWIGEAHNCSGRFKCDIDEPHTAQHQYHLCEGVLDPRLAQQMQWRRSWFGPSRADRHQYYWKPERAHVRADLHKALTLAGGGYEVDVEPVGQHRHATYGHGWWD